MKTKAPEHLFGGWQSGDRKVNRALSEAFGGERDGAYGREVVSAFWWTAEAVDSLNANCWLAATPYRFGFGKTSWGGSWNVFERAHLLSFQVGDSQHVQYQGTSYKQFALLTFTLVLSNYQQFQRHVILGSNEAQINRQVPGVVQDLQRLAGLGYPIVTGGPGWSSTGGYTTSYGVGFGF